MSRCAFILVCVTLAASPPRAPAAEPVAVAVLNFANQVQGPAGQEWNWLEKGLADLVINDLSTQEGLLLVDRERMQETLTAEGIPIRPGMDLSRVSRVFVKRFKVARLVFGSFRVHGENAVMNASIVDAYSGKLIRRVRVMGPAKDVLKLEKELTSRIIAALLGKGDIKEIAASLPMWTESLPASRLLYTAIDNFDRGEFLEAWLYGRRAWRVDRGYADALYWVGRLHYYLLHYAHARRYYEQFVYEHTTHPRIGDAVLEYLDTYERARPSTRGKIDEILRMLELAPTATVRRTSYRGTRNLTLPVFLKIRLASYYQSTTEYPLAARILANLPNRGDHESSLHDEVRLQAAVVLGQPGSPKLPADALTKWGRMDPPRFRLLRPGGDNRFLRPGKLSDSSTIDNELLTVPPNHRLRRVVVRARVKAPRTRNGITCKMLLCLSGGFGREQYSDAVAVTTRPSAQTWELAPLFRGKLFQAYLESWCIHRAGRVTLGPASVFSAEGMELVAQVAPAEPTGHVYLDRGFLGAFTWGWTHVGGCGVAFGRGEKWLTYLPCRRLEGRFYDSKRHPIPQRKPLFSFSVLPQRGQVSACRVGRSSGRLGHWPEDAIVHRMATNYSPSQQRVWRSPSLAGGTDGSWSAVWEVDEDLWLARSFDHGASWTPATPLPVPINSAHREWGAKLVSLPDGTCVLCFNSDRGLPRQERCYLSMSRDLRRWTAPRLAPIVVVTYAARGTNGEIILAGWDKPGWTDDGPRGPDRDTPIVWIARSRPDGSFERARLDLGRVQPHVLGVPLVAWYDRSDQRYHCIVVHWYQWNRRVPKEIERSWHYKPGEYVGTAEDGLTLRARFNPNFGFNVKSRGAIYKDKLILLDSTTAWAFVFNRPTLEAEYRSISLHPKCNMNCRLSDVAADGRLLMGVHHYTSKPTGSSPAASSLLGVKRSRSRS